MYSYNNEYPIAELPHRIRLSNGMTKTDSSTFTEEDISYAGFRQVEDTPAFNSSTQRLSWEIENGIGEWRVTDLTQEELWKPIREKRNRLMNEFEWRISRHNRETLLGKNVTETQLVHMYRYMQELADITKQEDPWNIVWPQYEVSELES